LSVLAGFQHDAAACPAAGADAPAFAAEPPAAAARAAAALRYEAFRAKILFAHDTREERDVSVCIRRHQASALAPVHDTYARSILPFPDFLLIPMHKLRYTFAYLARDASARIRRLSPWPKS